DRPSGRGVSDPTAGPQQAVVQRPRPAPGSAPGARVLEVGLESGRFADRAVARPEHPLALHFLGLQAPRVSRPAAVPARLAPRHAGRPPPSARPPPPARRTDSAL